MKSTCNVPTLAPSSYGWHAVITTQTMWWDEGPLLVAEVNFISRGSKNILPPKTKDLKLSFTYFNHCSKYVFASTTPLEYSSKHFSHKTNLSSRDLFVCSVSVSLVKFSFAQTWVSGCSLALCCLFRLLGEIPSSMMSWPVAFFESLSLPKKSRAIAPTLDLHPNPPEPDTLIHRFMHGVGPPP